MTNVANVAGVTGVTNMAGVAAFFSAIVGFISTLQLQHNRAHTTVCRVLRTLSTSRSLSFAMDSGIKPE
jgi:hypothetical protein